MTRDQLIAKLADIEWEDFEVKEAKSDIPKNAWETVSAFSNTAGGWLVFGVKKAGKAFFIVGVDNPEKIEQDFTNTLRTTDKFNTLIIPKCLKYDFEGNTVLAFYIPVSAQKPVYFNSIKNTFVRTASGDNRATQAEIDAMFRDQAFGTQSSKTIQGKDETSLDTNSLDRFRDYMSRYNSDSTYNKLTRSEFLEKLRIISNGELSYSGLLLLGKNDAIQDHFPDFRVDYLEVPGNKYTDGPSPFSFRLPEQENLWEYYFVILDRLRKYINIPINLTIEGFASEDVPQLAALREALVNFLMHCDYFSPMKPRIRVFDNRIEFLNPGAPPKSIETFIREDISLPRNPILAKLFRSVRLAENAGTGFTKMIRGWQIYRGQAPVFHQEIDYTLVTFWLLTEANQPSGIPSEAYTVATEKDDITSGVIGGVIGGVKKPKEGGVIGGVIGGVKTSKSSGVISGVKTVQIGGVTIVLSEKQAELIKLLIKDNQLSFNELAKLWNINYSAAQKHFIALKTKGAIRRMGPDKGGFWEVLVKL